MFTVVAVLAVDVIEVNILAIGCLCLIIMCIQMCIQMYFTIKMSLRAVIGGMIGIGATGYHMPRSSKQTTPEIQL